MRGKRAIVLLTDGKDEGAAGYADALEYAKHGGIAFYTIGLGPIANQPDIRLKLEKLAAETGSGRSPPINQAIDLGGTYRSIETELRSQYLLLAPAGRPSRQRRQVPHRRGQARPLQSPRPARSRDITPEYALPRP